MFDDKPQAMVNDIIQLASRIWEVPRAELTGQGRTKAISRVRQAVYLIAHEHGHSYVWIGKQCGKRDHTTVIHGIRNAEVHCQLFPDYLEKVALLRRQSAEAESHLTGRNVQEEMKLSFAPKIGFTKPEPTPPKKKPKNVFDAEGGDFTQDFIANKAMILANKRFVEALHRERAAA